MGTVIHGTAALAISAALKRGGHTAGEPTFTKAIGQSTEPDAQMGRVVTLFRTPRR